jgi:transcriptional regulator with XRE-family HTH domain
MVREALTEQDRARGRALGLALRRARGAMTVRELSERCRLAQETIRKIERGAVPTPALFTVAALADALGVQLDRLVHEAVSASVVGRGRRPTADRRTGCATRVERGTGSRPAQGGSGRR